MKKFLSAIALFTCIGSSAYASSYELRGEDASEFIGILKSAGVSPVGNSISGFDLVCEAIELGNNNCLLATTANDPATHRVSVPKNLSGEFWSLIKKAGIRPFVSETSDGTAGKLLITADSVECSSETESCVFQVSENSR